jgi:hypothetical protein
MLGHAMLQWHTQRLSMQIEFRPTGNLAKLPGPLEPRFVTRPADWGSHALGRRPG